MSAINNKEGKDWLIGVLKHGIVNIQFNKKDGTVRDMKCTLQEGVVPVYETKTTRTLNDDVLFVYDVEKSDWRSFRLDSVISVNFQA
jgi:hypothetical protein